MLLCDGVGVSSSFSFFSAISFIASPGSSTGVLEWNPAIAGLAQWMECRTADQRVLGWVLVKGTCLGCGLGPTCRRQPINDSLLSLMFLCLSSSPFLSEINKNLFLKRRIHIRGCGKRKVQCVPLCYLAGGGVL
uniref:Uncharacterized protein n=1 Tax=Myotis myotis TaxID=51298 RepID=A0A7J7S1Z5_MYOMY|nr:hypothetical protein mMyoMyo1_010056 [Myotis myotis]